MIGLFVKRQKTVQKCKNKGVASHSKIINSTHTATGLLGRSLEVVNYTLNVF